MAAGRLGDENSMTLYGKQHVGSDKVRNKRLSGSVEEVAYDVM